MNSNSKPCSAFAEENRDSTAGGIIQGHFVLCGGLDLSERGNFDVLTDKKIFDTAFDDCLITGDKDSYHVKREDTVYKRYSAAAVSLNETTLWIVGGRFAKRDDYSYKIKYSTYVTGSSEFVTLNQITKGPNLRKMKNIRASILYLNAFCFHFLKSTED